MIASKSSLLPCIVLEDMLYNCMKLEFTYRTNSKFYLQIKSRSRDISVPTELNSIFCLFVSLLLTNSNSTFWSHLPSTLLFAVLVQDWVSAWLQSAGLGWMGHTCHYISTEQMLVWATHYHTCMHKQYIYISIKRQDCIEVTAKSHTH